MSTSTFATLLAVTCLISSAAKAQEGFQKRASGTVAIVTAVDFTPAISRNLHERESFITSLSRSLTKNGWSTMEVPIDLPCEADAASDCLRAVGGAAGTKYVVRTTGKGNVKEGYTIQIEVYSAGVNEMKAVAAYCDICNADRLGEIAAGFADELLTAAAKQESRVGVKQRQASLPASPAVPPLPDPLLPPSIPPPPPTQWLAWSLIATGVISTSYGVWQLTRDAKYSDSVYTEKGIATHDRETFRTLGTVATVVGGVAAGTGLFLLFFRSLSVSPDHVALTARF